MILKAILFIIFYLTTLIVLFAWVVLNDKD